MDTVWYHHKGSLIVRQINTFTKDIHIPNSGSEYNMWKGCPTYNNYPW